MKGLYLALIALMCLASQGALASLQNPRCSTHVSASSNGRLGAVSVKCDVPVWTFVQLTDTDSGKNLCAVNHFLATEKVDAACTFVRNPTQRLDYRVTINEFISGAMLATEIDTLRKDPTFNYPPQGQLLTPNYLKPFGQNLNPPSNGNRWNTSIQVRVVDEDVDPIEDLSRITVELISKNTGAILQSYNANSGETISFNLEHTYDHASGSDPDSKEGLVRGVNTLIVRIHDAYTENRGSYIDVGPITVDLE